FRASRQPVICRRLGSNSRRAATVAGSVRASAIVALLLSRVALAHPLDVGALDLRAEGARVEVTLDVSASFWRKLTAVSETAPPPDARAFLDATLASGPLTVGGTTCKLMPREAVSSGERIILHALASCLRAADGTEGELTWPLPFVSRGTLTFQLLVHVERQGAAQETVLEPGSDTLHIANQPGRGFGDFVLMGMRHIGATPSEWWGPGGRLHLPEGIDHILFLLALLLVDVQ